MKDHIVIHGARQHNLKGFDLSIPRRSITVVTGPSGSGKSSLAFDTIYAEGQRRYVESLSAYARQFLERMEKPAVTRIDGLSPAVAIQQTNPSRSSRSTVGTATEIYDYLRLLWARVGTSHCPVCSRPVVRDTVQGVVSQLRGLPDGTPVLITFAARIPDGGSADSLLDALRGAGFMRLHLNGVTVRIDEPEVSRTLQAAGGAVDVVVDRLTLTAANEQRLAEGVELAFREGSGACAILVAGVVPGGAAAPGIAARNTPVHQQYGAADGGGEGSTYTVVYRFSERLECPWDGSEVPLPVPQLFSFNTPRGACPRCNGFGATLEYDEHLIIPDPDRSLREGAIAPWTMPRYEKKRSALIAAARSAGIPVDVPWRQLAVDARDFLLHGSTRGYKGVFPFLLDLEEKRYKQYIRIFLRKYQTARTCLDCGGARLNPTALLVRVDGRTIADVSALSIDELAKWLDGLGLSGSAAEVSRHVLVEARSRVHFLLDVGLQYMTLDRATRTLSGGEAQRIALSNAIGSRLVDTLYVLDEPSIGLHPRDLARLLSILRRLRDGGNTVLMVEHDLDAIRAADYMVELGPGSGELGGELVFAGAMSSVSRSPLTGRYLSGEREIALPDGRRGHAAGFLTVRGATEHNLQDIDVVIPIGTLTAVTGVSGSGKSTLVHDVIYRALEKRLQGEHSAREHMGERVGSVREVTGWERLDDVVLVDQSPIGRSARSNPITYVKAFDEIRRIFAATPAAKKRRFTAGTFSFNVRGGRCNGCDGAGYTEVEMVFMADVFVPCEECDGKRFQQRVLEITVNGRNIHEVLQMTVDHAMRFFPREERLGQALWQLHQVGLGYLRLGQPSNTLSGGEAQRLKIARELVLGARTTGRKLYIMDEPSTGLHLEDIRSLARVLDRLVERGHTVVVIEHNLDIIKLADWVIDLGPDGGDGGGRVVAMGTPEDVAASEGSHTGRWLRPYLGGRVPRAEAPTLTA